MKMKLVAAAVMGLTMSAAMAADALNTDVEKLSYSIGADLGRNFKRQGIDISTAAMAKGLQDGLSGGQLQLTDQQMRDVLNKFQKDLMTKRTADFNKKAEENKAKGEAFLNQNKTKEGVVSLPSGLQYKIIQKGEGAKPGKDDTVTVEYTGSLINGQVFDSTEKTGKPPATFKVSQVIPGWSEALQLMPSGSTWELYVPASLAYGPRGVGGPIGPNETLIFKVHLLSVKKAGT
jgi:FKBP-type peptidyl-prolyl cis-trans isomerase FklB